MKAVCVFDFDGTLVDSMGGFADLAGDLIAEAYQIPFSEARTGYLRTSGLPFFQQLESLFPGDTRNSRVAADFEAQKQDDYFSRPFFQEVPDAITELRELGIKSVISSNNGQELVEAYLQQRPEASFDLVLGFRDGFSKGPAHFQKVIGHFKLSTEAIVFIGDSLHDAAQARDFGVDFIGRTGTFSPEQFHEVNPKAKAIPTLEELIGVLCK